MTHDDDLAHLVDLMQDMPIAMFTTFGPEGPRTVPMARQEAEPSAELWFITSRSTEHTKALVHESKVALSFSSRDAWVALTGQAHVVDDIEKLRELWTSFAEAWLPGGPEDPDAVLLRVDVERAEYWDTPGGRIASLISFAKVKLTGDTSTPTTAPSPPEPPGDPTTPREDERRADPRDGGGAPRARRAPHRTSSTRKEPCMSKVLIIGSHGKVGQLTATRLAAADHDRRRARSARRSSPTPSARPAPSRCWRTSRSSRSRSSST